MLEFQPFKVSRMLKLVIYTEIDFLLIVFYPLMHPSMDSIVPNDALLYAKDHFVVLYG